MGLNPKGRDWGSLVNWDDLGKFYTGFIISWTAILYGGIAFLIINRNLAFIKIRNLPLAIAAVSFLHVYLVKIFLAYTTNGHFSCAAEFWIMSVYLPFGIALFQANLAQLRSISDQQQALLYGNDSTSETSELSRARRLYLRWHTLPEIKRTYLYIGLGMAVQLLMTGIIYAATPTLQGDWSSYGAVSHAKGQALCRKSPEWTPSAFWQLAWSWVYGPYLLLRVRDIHDIHYWRLQIICSVISGLPGTPLWLAAVFSTGFHSVNRWWVPPMWLAPGILVMQFTTVFFPVYEIFKSRNEMRSALAVLESWEDRHGTEKSLEDIDSSKASSLPPSTTSSQERELFTMGALEKALAVNPDPLLKFAATKDFTAENILFLTQVRRWKEAFAFSPRVNYDVTDSAKSQLFNSALEIYISRVNEKTTDFPINIEFKIRQDLDAVFGPAVPTGRITRKEYERYMSAGNFFKAPQVATSFDLHHGSESSDSTETPPGPILLSTENSMFPLHPGVSPLGVPRGKMRPEFNEHVFDAAESSIKYLVLTNTWQKFVQKQRSSMDSPAS